MKPSFDGGLALHFACFSALDISRMRNECICDPSSDRKESGNDENALFGFHINGSPGTNFDQLTCSPILTLTEWRLGMSHARQVRYPGRNQLFEDAAVRNKMFAVISPITRPRIHLCMLVSRLVSTSMVSNPEYFRCKAFKFRGKDFDRKIALQGKP